MGFNRLIPNKIRRYHRSEQKPKVRPNPMAYRAGTLLDRRRLLISANWEATGQIQLCGTLDQWHASTLDSPHFSPGFVARRFKGARWLAFATEGRAGVADTTLSSPTERKPDRACHGAVAAEVR
jgi:hypothetical protein